MAIPLYLAMTAEEYANCDEKPAHIAWMACHFSPYCTGITNLPPQLPDGSAVILNDRIPIDRHNTYAICKQLQSIGCSSILLDFQRIGVKETRELVSAILASIDCPVGVSMAYANGFDSPVLLPPIPPHISPDEYLIPYRGREIWLEAGLDTTVVNVTEDGADFVYPADYCTKTSCYDESLCCSYGIEVSNNKAVFTLQRRTEDFKKLLTSCEEFGVTRGIGLYQEMK